jgi:ATP-dependent RNA helicase DeaD
MCSSYLCILIKEYFLNNFSKLGLSTSVVEVLDQLGFTQPTPVQQKAIPILLGEDPTDFIGLAQTGTGKTAAFGLPLIDLIDIENPATQVLIMAPTRELSQQTAKQITDLSSNNKKLNIEVVYGGAAITNQMKALKKPTQILVATPGRLLDLIRRKAVKLEHVRYVVLDEADEMLNMGFKEDIDKILSFAHDNRVIWLFSATMPSEVRKIVNKYMHSPLEVTVNTVEISNKDISHKYVVTTRANKIPALRRFLDIQPEMRGVMFCRTKWETQEIADDLGNMGYSVEALHGDLSQGQRDSVMKRFKSRSMQLLIATDVAARGIDVNDLSHVIHHSLPDQLESYTHRSGRTGRAGKKGTSVAFINPREGRRITELEKKINVTFEKVEVPSVEELKSSRINNWANLIINTQVDKQAEGILNDLHGQFSHLSKEDLLERLITTQLDHLMIRDGEKGDLNEGSGSKTSKTFSNDGFNRYYVNIGAIDGVTEADLVHFLSDISGIARKAFGDISLQKNCAFFNINKTSDKGLSKKFEGIEIEGRSIRVNQDDGGGSKSKVRPSKKKNNNKARRNPPTHFGRSGNSRRDSRKSRSKRH